MSIKKLLFLSSIVLFFSYCSPKAEVQEFHWLIGKWEGKVEGFPIYEIWELSNENLLKGVGGVYSERDTLFSESMKIQKIDGDLFYIPTVPHNKGEVNFKFTQRINDTTLFENPEHNYPQKIYYYKNSPTSLYVRIQGVQDGIFHYKEFSLEKIK